MNSYEKSIVIEKFNHYFDGITPIDLNRIMVAVPTIKHRPTMTINNFNFLPNRFIFIKEEEKELYKPEIDDGWIPVFRKSFDIKKTRNEILEYFRNSKCDYLIVPDDEVPYRKVVVNNDTFNTTKVKDAIEFEELLKMELARMERDHIDVLTIPNAQFLTARTIDTVMNDKSAIDYSFILYTKRALELNNYWYETAPDTCEDLFMAKLLLADPNLKCRYAVYLRRDVQHSGTTQSTFGDADGHKAWQDKTNDYLEQLSAKGFTSDLMDILWTPAHRPIEYYPLNYRRAKKYIQEEPKWKQFIS